MRKVTIVATAVLMMAALPAFAQTKKPAKLAKATSDQLFVKNAASGGMAEVELGKLASEKAASKEVKDFGQKMIDDHTKANDELKSIAEKKNMQLPAEVTAKDKALRTRLAKLSGAAFDRAYVQAMLIDHRHDVKDFRREAQLGKDPEIKAFASKTLPIVEDHLKMAENTDKSVIGTTGTKKK